MFTVHQTFDKDEELTDLSIKSWPEGLLQLIIIEYIIDRHVIYYISNMPFYKNSNYVLTNLIYLQLQKIIKDEGQTLLQCMNWHFPSTLKPIFIDK
jgi:hypothetical protein